VVIYKRKAARPATAMKPGAAVWKAPPPVEVAVSDPVAEERAALPEDWMPLAWVDKEESWLETSEEMDAPVEDAPAASLDALAPAPPPKMVVLPTVLVRVESPEVMVVSIAEVVIAEELESVADPDSPAPPAPPEEMVVDPTVEVTTEPSELVERLTIAEVVMATPPAPAPPVPPVEVSVTVADAVVTVSAGPDPADEDASSPPTSTPASLQYCLPKATVWPPISAPQAW